MLRQECTVVHFLSLHILVNYAHNYVSCVSLRIITRSVSLLTHTFNTNLDVQQMCRFLKHICQTNSLHQAVFLSSQIH